MTGKLGDQSLDTLERRFQALRDRLGAMPEACLPELETALQELSQAIAALRAAGGSPPAEAPDCPEAADSPAPADTILYNIFRAIPDLLTVIDRDFNIIISNWHESDMVPEEARRGRPKCYQVYHHRDRPCEPCHVREVFVTGRPQKTEKINLLDGRTRAFIAFPILNESGQVILAAENVRDITDGRLVEQALKESEGRFRTLIEDSPETLFLTDVQGTVLVASRVAAERMGKELPEVVGRSAFEHLPPEVASRRWALFEQVIATGRAVRIEDVRGDRHFDINFNPILDADGKVSRVSIMAIDITDKKHAEAALKESEALFRAIFKAAQDAIFIKDRSLRYTQVNPAMDRLFGLSADDLTGLTEKDLFGEDAAVLVRKQDQRVLQGEVIKGVITLPVQGVPTPFHVIKVPLHDDAGQVMGVCGIARDITDLKQAEAALKESEERFRMLFDHAPDAYILADMQGEIIECNQTAAELTGYGREELVGNNFACLPWLDFRQQVRLADLLAQTARGEVMGPVDFTLTRKGGGEVIAEGMSLPLSIQGQNLVLTIVRDITARKRAEAALAAHLQFLQLLLDTIPNPIFFKDAQGAYLGCNKAFEDFLGVTRQEIVGKSVYDLSPKVLADDYHRMDAEAFQTTGTQVYESRVQDADGARRHVVFHKATFPGPSGGVGGLVGIITDITDLKQAEVDLRDREATLRTLIEANPESLFLLDTRGVILAASQVAAQRLDKTLEEIIGADAFALVPTEIGQKRFEIFQQVVATGSPERFEDVRGDFHLDISMTPIFSQDKVVQVAVLGVDLSLRKLAEAALRESEARFRTIFAHTLVGISMSDLTGRILQTNQALQQMLGYSAEELLGVTFQEVTHPEDLKENLRLQEELLAGKGQHYALEKRYLRKDGKIVWAHIMVALLRDDRGEPQYLLATVIDRTARKQAEAEVRESEQRFRLMAETIQDVFWIATPTLDRVIYASPAYEQVWGRSCQELYQYPQRLMESIHPEDRDRALSAFVAAREQGSPSDHEYRIVKPDGAVRWIHDRGYPVRDAQGRVIMFTGVATDITERKALEAQLLQAQKMEAVGRLAGGIAHDFNNLLMAITGYGELMRAKVLKDDPLYGYLEHVLKAGDRAAALTQQLLTFSRQKIVHPEVIDLNRVVLDLEPMLRRLIGEDLHLEVVTDRRLGAVKADPGQMGQVIMNLVVNARDAMPQGGRLTLKTAPVNFTVGCHSRFGLTPPGAYVMLVVEDTGVGMDEATQAHVFEPFFTTKEPGKGTGLGLSTVYGIVKQSGGYLDLESSPGAGSTFTIYLPRLEAIVEPPKAKIPLTASFRGEETILLVEDEDVLRSLLAKFLRLYGYTVLEARHGGEALLTCERHQGPIHVMVTDVVMPQMSGRELADRLIPLRPEMKVLYMSGYTEEALVQHGVADLSVAFLQKPFKPIELARRVHAVLHPPVSQ